MLDSSLTRTVPKGGTPGWKSLLNRFLSLAGLLALAALFAFLSPRFLTWSNLYNVALQSAINGIIAIGMTVVIITSGIDLSVGSVMALSICVAGLLMSPVASGGKGFDPWFSLAVGALVGSAAGLVNGLVITILRITPFIATLGMMSVARGLALVLTDGRPIEDVPDRIFVLGTGSLAHVPVPFWILLAVAGLGSLMLNRTRLGRYAYAIGSNEEAARLSGIAVAKCKVAVYGLMGLLTAIAGMVFIGRVSNAQPTAGAGFELDAIAAVVIGGASLMGGRGSILGTMVGVAIMGVLRNGLVLLDVSAFWQQLIIGVVIVFAVYLDQLRSRQSH